MQQLDQLKLSTQDLNTCLVNMLSQMKQGLQKHSQTLKMIPSFVVNLPKGTETGQYLALDLGGTNFRVCLVNLNGDGQVEMDFEKYQVSEQQKTSSGTELFDFFAQCVKDFVQKHNLDGKEIPLGFTFSFPVNQTKINEGRLIKWTKGFTASGVEDNDVVELLKMAFERKRVNVVIKAVVNDTVGTVMSHAYSKPDTRS